MVLLFVCWCFLFIWWVTWVLYEDLKLHSGHSYFMPRCIAFLWSSNLYFSNVTKSHSSHIIFGPEWDSILCFLYWVYLFVSKEQSLQGYIIFTKQKSSQKLIKKQKNNSYSDIWTSDLFVIGTIYYRNR